MSRTVTPTAQPQPVTRQSDVPREKIAARAFEKWVKRGKPMGNPELDWYEAEQEIRKEMGLPAPAQQQGPQRR